MLATLEAAPVQEDLMLQAVPMIHGSRVLDGYILGRKLGEGGMGAVYLGYHLELATRVAIKCLKTGQVGADEGLLRRFRNEAQLVASLNSPHLVRVNDARYSHGLHYLVLEFVDGETLTDRVERRGGALPAMEACMIALQASRGLSGAHAGGTVHRDIKPPNIMVSRDGAVKIMDLGIARTSDARFTMVSAGDEVIGTPQYMAPEQFNAPTSVGPRTDVYALGATLFFMLTGRHAFEGGPAAAVMHLVLEEGLAPEAEWGAGLPGAVVRIVARCMARDPAERYGSMDALGADLSAAIGAGGGAPSLADAGIPGVEEPPDRAEVARIRRVLEARRGAAPETVPERGDRAKAGGTAESSGLSRVLAGLTVASLLVAGGTAGWMVWRPGPAAREAAQAPPGPVTPPGAPEVKPATGSAPGRQEAAEQEGAAEPRPAPGPTPAEVSARRRAESSEAATSGDWARVFELLEREAAEGGLESEEALRHATAVMERFRGAVPKADRLRHVPRLMESLGVLVGARCGGAGMLMLEQVTRYSERDRLEFESLDQVRALAELAGEAGVTEAWRVLGEAYVSRHRSGAEDGLLQQGFDALERAESAGAPDAAARLAALYAEFIARPSREPSQLAGLSAGELRARGVRLAEKAVARQTPRGWYVFALFLNDELIAGGNVKRNEYLRLAADTGYAPARWALEQAARRP